MVNTLFLRFQGPMQSWGERAHWSERDTALEPTKSGIVGLLACALGWDQDDDLRSLSLKIRVGVRCDNPGVRLVDYHTIGGGYSKPMLLRADGKPKLTPSKQPHTEISNRTYLADASFLVAIQSDQQIITQLAIAVQNPVWPYYLGRKSCPPALPVFAGTGDFQALREALEADQPEYPTRIVLECSPDDPDAIRRRDEVDSHFYRTYLPRYARESSLPGLRRGKE